MQLSYTEVAKDKDTTRCHSVPLQVPPPAFVTSGVEMPSSSATSVPPRVPLTSVPSGVGVSSNLCHLRPQVPPPTSVPSVPPPPASSTPPPQALFHHSHRYQPPSPQLCLAEHTRNHFCVFNSTLYFQVWAKQQKNIFFCRVRKHCEQLWQPPLRAPPAKRCCCCCQGGPEPRSWPGKGEAMWRCGSDPHSRPGKGKGVLGCEDAALTPIPGQG